jgi:hypothetical protein
VEAGHVQLFFFGLFAQALLLNEASVTVFAGSAVGFLPVILPVDKVAREGQRLSLRTGEAVFLLIISEAFPLFLEEAV